MNKSILFFIIFIGFGDYAFAQKQLQIGIAYCDSEYTFIDDVVRKHTGLRVNQYRNKSIARYYYWLINNNYFIMDKFSPYSKGAIVDLPIIVSQIYDKNFPSIVYEGNLLLMSTRVFNLQSFYQNAQPVSIKVKNERFDIKKNMQFMETEFKIPGLKRDLNYDVIKISTVPFVDLEYKSSSFTNSPKLRPELLFQEENILFDYTSLDSVYTVLDSVVHANYGHNCMYYYLLGKARYFEVDNYEGLKYQQDPNTAWYDAIFDSKYPKIYLNNKPLLNYSMKDIFDLSNINNRVITVKKVRHKDREIILLDLKGDDYRATK